MSYPTNKYSFVQTNATDKTDAVDHNGIHNNLATTVNALQDKVGINSDPTNTSFDYKLSGVTGTDKAVSKTGTETLTNKTITAPSISSPNFTTTISNLDLTTPKITTSINDSGGNEVIKTPATASAVNEITITNSATGNDPSITATGDDTNISLKIKAKGTGKVKLGSADIQFPNADGTSSQLLQTNGAGVLSFVSGLTSVPLVSSDGSDGNATISSGTTTLTRDMYYNDLTVNGTGTLNAANYRIFVKGTCTVDTSGGGGGIQNKGGAGGNGNQNGTAGTAGTAVPAGSYPAGLAGKAGGTGGTGGGGAGSAGTAGTAQTLCLNNNSSTSGGAGGTGTGTGGAGGVGAVATSGTSVLPRSVLSAFYAYDFTGDTAIARHKISPSGGGGGGGGGGNAAEGGGGGGSGTHGGYLLLACKTLSITGTGAISASGGNGGNGGSGHYLSGNGSGGGGGAGGNGGVAVVFYFSKSGTGTIVASGGTGGSAGGTGGGTGGAGTAGTNGVAGLAIEITT